MSKIKTVFECQSCGYASPKWLGKCPDCGSWNSFSEERQISRDLKAGGATGEIADALSLSSITRGKEQRNFIGIPELDRVLGGGLVDGAMVLIGGDPGIGKSTLILQALAKIAGQKIKSRSQKPEDIPQSSVPKKSREGFPKSHIGLGGTGNFSELKTVLYVSGEESPEQIKLRAERLSINADTIVLLPETFVENIIIAATDIKPSV